MYTFIGAKLSLFGERTIELSALLDATGVGRFDADTGSLMPLLAVRRSDGLASRVDDALLWLLLYASIDVRRATADAAADA